jgi:hypothetical protein
MKKAAFFIFLGFTFYLISCGSKQKSGNCSSKEPIELDRNTSSQDHKNVEFQLTSDCPGGYAYILVLDPDPTHNDSNRVNIPPETDAKYPFSLPPGSRLYFKCGNGDGKCYYTQTK